MRVKADKIGEQSAMYEHHWTAQNHLWKGGPELKEQYKLDNVSDMDFTPKLVSGHSGQQSARSTSRLTDCTPTGHPARGRSLLKAGLLAHGSVLLSVFPAYASDMINQNSPLTVAGAASASSQPSWQRLTEFPLSFRLIESKEPRTLYIVDEVKRPSTDSW
jgi:hypothetical protein